MNEKYLLNMTRWVDYRNIQQNVQPFIARSLKTVDDSCSNA